MSMVRTILAGAALVAVIGCTSVATSTNSLTNERIVSETAGVLGYAPKDLALTSRRTEGTNTFVTLKAVNGKEYACVVNGGNLLSFGMTNAPRCKPKGEPIKMGPFQK